MKRVITTLLLVTVIGLAACGDTSGLDSPADSADITDSAVAGPDAMADEIVHGVTVSGLSGSVSVTQGGENKSASTDMSLSQDDGITTATDSWAGIEITDGRTVYLEENTEVEITRLDENNTTLFLAKGKIWADVENKLGANESLIIQTPNTALSVTGTLLYIEAMANDSSVCVIEGQVEVKAQGKDGSPLTDEEGNAVAMTVSAGNVAQVTAENDTVTDAWQGAYIMADIAPFADGGEAGPGGLYAELREQNGDLVWKEEVVSYGRSRTVSGTAAISSYENYCGFIDLTGLGMTVSFPEGGDMHVNNPAAKDNYSSYFPDGKEISSLGLYITDSGIMDYHVSLISDIWDTGYFDVYNGAFINGNIEFVRVQQETGLNTDIVLPWSGLTCFFRGADLAAGGYDASTSYSLVLSTSDVNEFMVSGILAGYEDAPFLDALRDTLTYTHKETHLISPSGGSIPVEKPVQGVVTNFGRTGTYTSVGRIYTYTGGSGAGSIASGDSGLTWSLPADASLHIWHEGTRDDHLPSSPYPAGFTLVVTNDGTYSAHYLANTERYKEFFRDVYAGKLVDANVEFVLAESHTGTDITVNYPTGFTYVYVVARVGAINTAFSCDGTSSLFVISTAMANEFLASGVLDGFEDLPQTFLDALREELYYAYKEYAPEHR